MQIQIQALMCPNSFPKSQIQINFHDAGKKQKGSIIIIIYWIIIFVLLLNAWNKVKLVYFHILF